MDAIVGVWLSSVLGAAAFSAAGYVLGKSAPVPAPEPPPPAAVTVTAAKPKKKKKKEPGEPASTPDIAVAPAAAEAVTPVVPAVTEAAGESQSKIKTVFPPPAPETEPELPDDPEVEERPTLMPDLATHEAMVQSSVATIPPSPRTPSMLSGGHDATRAMIADALAQVEQAAERTRSLEIVKNELERQVEIARHELRNEVIMRAAAEARSEELSDRLARASEEASSLRHRVNMLDRQTKLLRESLKGRGPVNDPRKRDEEAEEMRLRLRDVVDKLERASMPPPPSSVAPPNSKKPTLPPSSDSMPRSALAAAGIPRSLVPIHDDTAILREEIARLAQENRALRQQALGSVPPKPKHPARDSIPEIDLDLYKLVIERLTSVAGLKGAILADEVGALLVGTGELAENLAAFGAYIRDAGARTDRLLPLEGVEEVDIRDSNGMLLSTRVVLHNPVELSLVFLASADASMIAAKKIIDETLWLKR